MNSHQSLIQTPAWSALGVLLLIGACGFPTEPDPPDPNNFPKPREVVDSLYVVLDNGLKYYDFKEGEGSGAKNGDEIVVHYHGWLTDSTLFDTSFGRETPFNFLLGSGFVIEGWDIGIVGMREGGERQLVIPPELGYGEQGHNNIPPNATLIFEVFMVDINP